MSSRSRGRRSSERTWVSDLPIRKVVSEARCGALADTGKNCDETSDSGPSSASRERASHSDAPDSIQARSQVVCSRTSAVHRFDGRFQCGALFDRREQVTEQCAGLGSAGRAGLVYGWPAAMIGIQCGTAFAATVASASPTRARRCIANSPAELSSSMPTAGGPLTRSAGTLQALRRLLVRSLLRSQQTRAHGLGSFLRLDRR